MLSLFLMFLTAALLTATKNPKNPADQTKTEVKPGYYMVTNVVDGDTIKVKVNGAVETVRLIGIDSPELPNDCFAQRAKIKAFEALRAQQVKLEADETQNNRDRFGRLLRYVILEDGTNFNQLMIAEGYAREFTFMVPYKFQAEFEKAQAEAEKNKLGLWAPKTC